MAATTTQREWAAVLWARKWIVIGAVVVCVGVTELVTALLTPVYSTSAILLVAQPTLTQAYSTVDANEELARSYAQVLQSSSFASQVAASLGGRPSASSLQSSASIQPVSNTSLVTISASSHSRTEAKRIADAYASVAVTYVNRLTTQTKATVTVAASASMPRSPSQPKPSLYGLVALIVGLFAGVGLAFLRDRFDRRIRSREALAAFVDVPVVADVPVRHRDPGAMRSFTEAFRVLRTTLKLGDSTENMRSIALVSWGVGEGKTTVASQLALSLAATNTPTLIIDGDVHRPGLPGLLLPPGETFAGPGLTDYLLGAVPVDDAIQATHLGGLELMPRGRGVPDLSSLLETPRGRVAFRELLESHSSIVVDCPPLVAGADAGTIASRVDGVILVVDLDKATTKSVKEALAHLEAARATLIGIAVNRDRDDRIVDYYHYSDRGNGTERPLRVDGEGRARRVWRR